MPALQCYMLLLLLLGTGMSFGQAADTLPPPPEPEEEMLFGQIQEYQPLIGKCVELYDEYYQQLKCTQDTLIKHLYANLKWPGPDVCIEGMAVVSFSVEEDGTVTEYKLWRDPGQGTGEEALRAVKAMVEATAPWVPGTQGPESKPVTVQFNLPVTFKL
ncbi:MAG: energy transducer TonB, partial [Bacteroidota bacterium]